MFALFGCYSGSRPPRIGSNAPEFTVQDAQNTITLSQYRGQVVVLNFWATWCAPCVEELPSLVEMQRRLKAKGVTVLAVSVDGFGTDEEGTGHFRRSLPFSEQKEYFALARRQVFYGA